MTSGSQRFSNSLFCGLCTVTSHLQPLPPAPGNSPIIVGTSILPNKPTAKAFTSPGKPFGNPIAFSQFILLNVYISLHFLLFMPTHYKLHINRLFRAGSRGSMNRGGGGGGSHSLSHKDEPTVEWAV